LDLINGNLIWQTPTQNSAVMEDSFSIKYSKIVLENKRVYFSNDKNQFFNINSENGNLNWSRWPPSPAPPPPPTVGESIVGGIVSLFR